MKKFYLYFNHFSGIVLEGGGSRNEAFLKYFENKKTYNLLSLKIIVQIFYIVKYNWILIFKKEEKIFMSASMIAILARPVLYNVFFMEKIFLMIYNKIAGKNQLIVDISDLGEEQCDDLELAGKRRKQRFQRFLFKIKGLTYVFASKEMMLYSIKKYNLNFLECFVCINGGIELTDEKLEKDIEEILATEKIKFVYSGALNRGRQISKMIDIFERNSEVILFLLGSEGEWLEKENLPKHIKYVGNISEKKAHTFISKCDIGLIPYDDTRFYYNLCYPTKTSFYITAGIPFLCTNLKEIKNWIEKEKICYFLGLENWDQFIKFITKDEIEEKKRIISKIKYKFEWKYLIKELQIKLDIK